MIRRHNATLTLLLVILLALLAACDGSDQTPTPITTQAAASQQQGTPPISEGTTTEKTPGPGELTSSDTVEATPTPLTGHLVLWHSWAQAEGDALAAILAQLKVVYPEVAIDTLFVAPNDLVSSYSEAVAAGGGPDLLLASNWWLGELATANAILNLDTVVGGNPDASYWPASVEAMRYQGALYGFPMTSNLVALYANNNLVPPEGIPTNTDALIAAATTNPTAGIGLYSTLFHAYWGFPAYGAQLLNDEGTVTLDQGNGAADYLAWLSTVNGTPGSYVNSDYGMLLDRFKKGEFAYLVDGPWAITELRTVLGDALSVAPLPAGPAGSAQPWLYSDGLLVNPIITGDQQTLALKVALYFSGDEAAAILANIGGLLPAARNADLSTTPLLQGFAAQAATAQAMPTTPEMDNVWAYGGDMLIKALSGVNAPTTIVAETTTLINEANGK